MQLTGIQKTYQLSEFCAIHYPDKPVFFHKKQKQWCSVTGTEYNQFSDKLALGLISEGCLKGENIATIFSNNSYYWNIIDAALSKSGIIHLPVYPTISDSDYLYILNEAEIRVVIVSDEILYKRVKRLQPMLEKLEKVYSADFIPGVLSIDWLIGKGDKASSDEIKEFVENKNGISENDVVSIVYTSGSTGFPKGVMLTHKNLVSNMYTASELQPLNHKNHVMSFLPLCHIYERTANYQFQLKGSPIYYCEHLNSLISTLQEVKPHGLTVVPRLLEKIIKVVQVNSRNHNCVIRFLIRKSVNLGFRYSPGKTRFPVYNIFYRIANSIVFRRVRKSMGGRVKYIGCGGAPIHEKIERFFWAAKMPVYQGYGLTECSPLVSLNFPGEGNYCIGSAGKPVRNVKVKIASDGEILCSGPNVMAGYYKNKQLTDSTIVDGWLKTGDIGRFVKGGFLQITGRKKQMFKTSYGKYVVPQAIENKFHDSLCIEHIVIIGEGKHCAAAVIAPNFDYFRAQNPSFDSLSKKKIIEQDVVKQTISREIDLVNRQLGKTERIKKFFMVPHSWSVETGELSSTFKIKRNIIQRKYQKLIKTLFENESV